VVKSDSPEGLLVSWLNELIFRFDTYGFVGKKIRVSTLDDYRIKAYVSGEDFDEERHERGLLVKAATYHRLKVERGDGIWVVEVIFDI
jgi:SHS2 domain-containing protein